MNKPLALFDLDGTMADYDGAMKRDLAALASPGEPKYPHSWNKESPQYFLNRISMIKDQPGWWLNLEKFQLGFDVLQACLEIDFGIHILTKGPSYHPRAWTEKVEWVNQNIIPVAPEAEITITGDKGIVYGRVLVDDFPDYLQRWLKHRPRGLGIMPASDVNENFTHPQVVRYDGNNLDEVVERLKSAHQLS